MVGLLLLLSPTALAAPGSWVASVPGLMVAMSDRAVSTQSVAPPPTATVGEAQITHIQWQYRHPPGTLLRAWLCHPEQCVPLRGMRGATQAFAGMQAQAPIHFRFALTPGQRPVKVQGLQVIVDYQ
ncbi:flagellar protein FlhE [Halomonas sediminis]